MLVGTPFVEAEQDSPIGIEDLPKDGWDLILTIPPNVFRALGRALWSGMRCYCKHQSAKGTASKQTLRREPDSNRPEFLSPAFPQGACTRSRRLPMAPLRSSVPCVASSSEQAATKSSESPKPRTEWA
jgi:hypothetical protein